MSRGLRWAALCAVVLWLAGCATTTAPPPAPPASLSALPAPAMQRYTLALGLLGGGRPEAAAPLLQSLLDEHEGVPELHFNLALAQYRLEADQPALAALEPLLAGAEPRAHNLAGLLALRAGDVARAREAFAAALAAAPDYPEALYNMGLLMDVYLQDPPAAAPYYRAYLTQRPDDDDTRTWLEYLEETAAAP